ncbi:hypothetical protein [Streptomyces sp. NPDC002685]|uniref:hypothetical protein n=1 Tax=Streptomyces sp. NPDC002685 TaxID=3154540 RepID=UPI003319C473
MKYIGRAVAVTASAALAAMALVGQASADAQKKDNHVHVTITGKKLHVSQAGIFAGGPQFNICLDGRLTFTPPHRSPTIYYTWHGAHRPCGNSDGYSDLAGNTRWPNNTEVCATFYGMNDGKRWGGKPCATIHN